MPLRKLYWDVKTRSQAGRRSSQNAAGTGGEKICFELSRCQSNSYLVVLLYVVHTSTWMKEQDHFTNLKGSLQVLQLHVGRKPETITDIITSFACVGQICGEDEALEAQGLSPLDQLLRNCPVAVDVELEPSEAPGGGCRDFLQRAGGVRAGNVAGVHGIGRFGRYGKNNHNKGHLNSPTRQWVWFFLYIVYREHLNSCCMYILPNTELCELASTPQGLQLAVFALCCCGAVAKKFR